MKSYFLGRGCIPSTFSVTRLGFRKIKIQLNNIIPSRFSGSWEKVTRLRGRLNRCRPNEPEPDNTGGGKKVNQTESGHRHIFPTKILAEIIVLVALAAALSLISHSFFRMPQGGSINLGMVPIFWLALRRGPKIGTFAGAVFGIVDLTIEPFVVHPIQFILDYPLPFAVLGLAGFFKKYPVIGVILGGAARFVCHFISGVVYFGNYAPEGMSPIVYSAAYNGTYLIPSIIICAVIIGVMQKSKALNIYI
jgi:thiamine transporter